MKILIVDDDKAVRDIMPMYLEGHDVALASDGLEGLVKAREWQPDLIISDTEMPNMSGPDMLDTYRAERPDAPAILMSGNSLKILCEMYPSAAKYAFLKKPFTSKEFKSVFDEVTQTS